MVKKMKSSTEGASASAPGASKGSHLASSVKESAQQIWLAGMGAFSKAQEEGGKMFEALVKEGINLQRKTQAVAEDKLGEASAKMSAMAGTVSAKAGQNWDKLESIFEERTAKAMHKLGVPTARDVNALAQRVDELAAALAKLSKAGKATPAAAPKAVARVPAKPAPKPAAKATAKRAPRKAAGAS